DVFMRGIRAPRKNLSEKNKERRLSSRRVIKTAIWTAPLLDCPRSRQPVKVDMKQPSSVATRRSLVERLADWGDQRRWQEFFDTYWKLIYSVARQSGLTDAEAQEVVQETVITVAKNIDKLRYDPAVGSFKGWLLQITRWRTADQFRKRE